MTTATMHLALPANWILVDPSSLDGEGVDIPGGPIVTALRYERFEDPPTGSMTIGVTTVADDDFFLDSPAKVVSVGQYGGRVIPDNDQPVLVVPKPTTIGTTAVAYFTGEFDFDLFGVILDSFDLRDAEEPEAP